MLEPWEKVVYYVGMFLVLMFTVYGLWRLVHLMHFNL